MIYSKVIPLNKKLKIAEQNENQMLEKCFVNIQKQFFFKTRNAIVLKNCLFGIGELE